MKIKKLEKSEITHFRQLIEIFADVFESDAPLPNDQHLSRVLSDSDFGAFVIEIDGNVVGGLTLYVLQSYYHVKPMAYLYDVGIARDFQRQGLGQLLIAEVCNYCRENGFENAFVQAESNDWEAVHFYRKTAFHDEMNAVHFTYRF